MFEWLYSNMANILIISAVLGIVTLVIVSMVSDKKAGKSCSCGCSCSHCAMAGKCHSVSTTKKM